MSRFYTGYCEYLKAANPLITEDMQPNLGLGSIVMYRLKPEEVYNFARDLILKKIGETNPDASEGWARIIQSEDSLREVTSSDSANG